MLHLIFLYHCEARQMPGDNEVLQLEPVLGSYEACKFSHTFLMKKPINYNPLELLSKNMFMTCV